MHLGVLCDVFHEKCFATIERAYENARMCGFSIMESNTYYSSLSFNMEMCG
jgi:hypothetical protein